MAVNMGYDKNTAVRMRDFLIKQGLTREGAYGMLANLYSESGFRSNNAQNTVVARLGMTDETYTSKVDSGEYTDFVTDRCGYGICQWTSSGRKQGLLNYAKSRGVSIGDEAMQLDYLMIELISSGYKNVLDFLKTSHDISDCAKYVMTKFERPANQSEDNQNKRASYGLQLYEDLESSKKQTTTTSSTAEFTNETEYIEKVAKYVKKYAPQYNIKVYSPIIAQFCLECGYGTSNKVKKVLEDGTVDWRHNYAGLKWRNGRCAISNEYFEEGTSEQNADGSYTGIVSKFFRFKSLEDCVIGYFQFTNIPAYSNLKGVTDPETYLKNIKEDKYATSIDYVQKNMNVIKKWNLTKYDLKSNTSSTTTTTIYRVRKSWGDASSQIGAYYSLESAKSVCKVGYSVFDSNGNEVYSNSQTQIQQGSDNMKYTNSPLVTYTKISPNKTSPRNHVIDTITIHCYVGQVTAERGCNGSRFVTYNSTNGASCNYVVGYDGSIGLCVEEKDRSWCSSNKSNDHRAITIEVASETVHPYKVTDKALDALIRLIADICKRNDIKELKWKADKSLIGKVNEQNMTVHRWFAAKSCPGDYLYNKHSYIADEVNKRLGIKPTTTIPTSTPTQNASVIYRIRKSWKDASSQIGAYSSLEGAKAACKSGYYVFDASGNVVYPTNTMSPSSPSSTNSSYSHKDFVKEVQAALGAKVDGIAGKETLSKTVTVSKTKNRKHAVVKPIQKYLNSLGYNCGTPDGIAGAKFDTALKAFQKANGCVADGEATSQKSTWKKLLKL